MNTPSDPRSFDRTVDSQHELAELCRQFASDWQNIRLPRVEEFVAKIGPAHRDRLIDKLKSIESENLSRLKLNPVAERHDELGPHTTLLNPPEGAAHEDEGTVSVPHQSFESTIGNKETADRGLSSADSATDFSRPPGIRFENLRPHAQGGLGQVSRAWDCELDREVALKQIKEAYADDSRNRVRFVTEAKVTGQLEHPGIVPVYGFGIDSHGRPYYAMRFIKGDSLKQAIEKFHAADSDEPFDRMELRSLLRRFVDVCNAVEFAHSRHVIHRDIKPANVMLGGFGETLLVDWGLAKKLDAVPQSSVANERHEGSSSDQDGSLGEQVGTPAYMSPKQAVGRPGTVGSSSDIYSLGATLFHLLTGRPPITGHNIDEILECVEAGDFEPPRNLNALVPKPLEAICLKAMAQDENARYASAVELADEIEHWLADEPVKAYREPISAKLWRWGRRHRSRVAGATIAILVSLVSLIVVVAVIANTNRELKDTNGRLDNAKTELESRNLALAEANDQVIAAEKIATEERDMAVAINDFIIDDLLGKAFPTEEPNRDIKLREVVDRAAARIDGRFVDQPIVEAEIRHSIGRIYRDLTELDPAEVQLERALEIRNERLGSRHPDTLACRHNLALVYVARGDYDLAENEFTELLEIMIKDLGEDHAHSIATIGSLARVYDLQGRPEMAGQMFQKSHDLSLQKWGPKHADSITSLNKLAYWHQRRGNYDLAEQMFDRTLAVLKEKHGIDDPRTLNTLHNIASVYHRQGRTQEALELFEIVVEASGRVNGEHNLKTLTAQISLATAYEMGGDSARAEKLLLETREALNTSVGSTHPFALLCVSHLGEMYTDQRRYAEALPLLKQAAEGQRIALRADHPERIRSLNYLSKVHLALGQPSEAEPLLKEVLNYFETRHGDEHPETQEVLLSLVRIYWSRSQTDQSIPLLERYYAAVESTKGPDHKMTVIARANLALNLHSAGQVEEALRLLNESFAGSVHIKGLSWVPNAIFESNVTLGKQEDAIAFIDDLLAAETQRTSNRSEEYVGLLAGYGFRCLELEAYAKAAELFERIIEKRDQIDLEDWNVESVRFMLGIARLGLQEFEEADRLLSEGAKGMELHIQDAPENARQDMIVQTKRVASMYEAHDQPSQALKWRLTGSRLGRQYGGDTEPFAPIHGARPPRPAVGLSGQNPGDR